jgi:hypothetical protein
VDGILRPAALKAAADAVLDARDDLTSALEFLRLIRSVGVFDGSERRQYYALVRNLEDVEHIAKIEANGACELYLAAVKRRETIAAAVPVDP